MPRPDGAFGTLTAEQAVGEACGICHARWPLPQIPLREPTDGATIYVCRDCGELAGMAAPVTQRSSLVMH